MKAKTKTKLLLVLNALLGVVFAFLMGFTYASSDAIKIGATKKYLTGLYLENDYCKLVNTTLSQPVPYGEGFKHTEVAIDYCLNYAFDFMLEYSLTWDDGSSASDDVILHFSNRDNFIVDENYIYYTGTLEGATNKFNIITGVEFLNSNDSSLFGKSLTISATLKTEKSQNASYSSGHSLYKNSTASNAWVAVKSGVVGRGGATSSTSNIIAYNYRYNQNNGIVYPKETANNDVTNLYGNTYNAGAALHVFTGANALTITVQSIGYWDKVKLDTTQIAFTNNIHYNFSSDWGTVTYYNENHTQATIKINAGQSVYLNIFDSMEITSVMETSSESIGYDDYKLLSSYNVNGKLIQGSKITYLTELSNAGSGTTYSSKSYEIVNTSTYNKGLYDAYNGSGAKDFVTSLAITNKTSSTQTYTVAYQPQYTTSNGNKTLQSGGGSDAFGDDYWGKITNTFGNSTSDSVVVEPYSTVTLTNLVTATTGLRDMLNINSAFYDAWVGLAVNSVSASAGATATTNSVSIEMKVVTDGTEIYATNNSNVATTISGSITLYKAKETYTAEQGNIANWNIKYWQYYTLNGSTYTQATAGSEYNSSITYYKREVIIEKENVSVATAIIAPGASVLVGKSSSKSAGTWAGTESFTRLVAVSGSLPATVTEEPAFTIVQNGTANAYIKNFSNKTYYVRFNGSASGTSIVTDGGYNYYIGIIRPGQIVEISMTEKATIIQTIEVDEEFSKSDLTSWNVSSKIENAFETYFS